MLRVFSAALVARAVTAAAVDPPPSFGAAAEIAEVSEDEVTLAVEAALVEVPAEPVVDLSLSDAPAESEVDLSLSDAPAESEVDLSPTEALTESEVDLSPTEALTESEVDLSSAEASAESEVDLSSAEASAESEVDLSSAEASAEPEVDLSPYDLSPAEEDFEEGAELEDDAFWEGEEIEERWSGSQIPKSEIYEKKVKLQSAGSSRPFSKAIEIQMLLASAVDPHPDYPHPEPLAADAPAQILAEEGVNSSKSAYERRAHRSPAQKPPQLVHRGGAGCLGCAAAPRRRTAHNPESEDTSSMEMTEASPASPPTLRRSSASQDLAASAARFAAEKPMLYEQMISSLRAAASGLRQILKKTKGGIFAKRYTLSDASGEILTVVVPRINEALEIYNSAKRDTGGLLTLDIDKYGNMNLVFEARDLLRTWATATAVIGEEWPKLCEQSDRVFVYTIEMLQILVKFAEGSV